LVIGEYGAGGGEGASHTMVTALVVMRAVAVEVIVEVVVATLAEVGVVVAAAACETLASAVALPLFVATALEERFLLTLLTGFVKNRRCILPELGPAYRPLSRPRCCWFRFLLL
jgi:hypothetical protein